MAISYLLFLLSLFFFHHSISVQIVDQELWFPPQQLKVRHRVFNRPTEIHNCLDLMSGSMLSLLDTEGKGLDASAEFKFVSKRINYAN